ncbi:hypothetical protein JWH04_10550 [Xanthomonas melonis]|uniref:hypothetical protein n=1 Tax=Xanthomonas melonis TaxID=56456 RepID=UPI001E49C267|nr:hypothetical protein [Xanthomonas melonis]MCD0279374.1 hypothetical protein [Xanthomonas melonis]
MNAIHGWPNSQGNPAKQTGLEGRWKASVDNLCFEFAANLSLQEHARPSAFFCGFGKLSGNVFCFADHAVRVG